jgi:hypothetical protein
MELTTVVLTKDVVMEEAGDAMEWVDTAAAVSAITERMQEKLVALDVVELLGDSGVSIDRITDSGVVAFMARCDGLPVCTVQAARVGARDWSVLVNLDPEAGLSRLVRGGASAATCFAACMLLAASTVRDKGGTDGE